MTDKGHLMELFDEFEGEIKQATNVEENEFVPMFGLSEEDIEDLPEGDKQMFYSDDLTTAYEEDKDKYIEILSYIVDNGPVTKKEIQSNPPGSEIPHHKISWILRVLTSRQLVEQTGGTLQTSSSLSKKLK